MKHCLDYFLDNVIGREKNVNEETFIKRYDYYVKFKCYADVNKKIFLTMGNEPYAEIGFIDEDDNVCYLDGTPVEGGHNMQYFIDRNLTRTPLRDLLEHVALKREYMDGPYFKKHGKLKLSRIDVYSNLLSRYDFDRRSGYIITNNKKIYVPSNEYSACDEKGTEIGFIDENDNVCYLDGTPVEGGHNIDYFISKTQLLYMFRHYGEEAFEKHGRFMATCPDSNDPSITKLIAATSNKCIGQAGAYIKENRTIADNKGYIRSNKMITGYIKNNKIMNIDNEQVGLIDEEGYVCYLDGVRALSEKHKNQINIENLTNGDILKNQKLIKVRFYK